MPKNFSKSQKLAMWFWSEILHEESGFFDASNYIDRMRLLGQCKKLLVDGKLDAEIVKKALLLMIESAVMPKYPNDCYLYDEPTTGMKWYDVAKNPLALAPPIYDTLNLKRFLKQFDPQNPLLQQLGT